MAQFNIRSNINDLISSFGSFRDLLRGGVRTAILSVNTALRTLAANPIVAVLTVIVTVIGAVLNGLRQLQPVVDEINVRIAQLSAAWQFFD